MAYCVHCGVKLGAGEKRCPLCQTPVCDPAEPVRPAAPKPYPVRTPEQELKRSKRFLLTLAALMLLAPAGLCFVIDLLITGGITWSSYASGALIMLFVSVAVPLAVPKYQAYFAIATSFLCLNGYLFLVERLSGSVRWFFPIALPALALAAVIITLITMLWRRGWLNKLTLLGLSFAGVALECLSIEWLHSAAYEMTGGFVWSPFVLAPCLFIALSLFFINGNRSVREEVRRRVHF
ncbi:MAG: hypothetical protein IKH30_09895 [Clostridia bacterium]|nr:hypothetical protein [Clostridia bacterium]MBR4539583.1 hypothetical protein [Clostridia bacterium]